jgi:prevent-host-death family protein
MMIVNTPTNSWQLQDAKARLSEVVRRALTQGPQRVTVRGAPAVLVIAEADYQQSQPLRTGADLLERFAQADDGFDFPARDRAAAPLDIDPL